MVISETGTGWKPKPLHIIALLLVLQLLVTLFIDGFTLSFDEAMWHYIGRNWFRHGLVPYAGGADNKSPLIFAIFGLSDQLFGVNYWFPRVLGTICESMGIYYVYKIAKHSAGENAGILAMSFYGLSLLWHTTGGKYVSYTETYSVMFLIIAVYKFISAENGGGFFISGFLAGIAFGFRLTAIFGIITLFIASMRKGKLAILVLCAGVLSGILLLILAAFLAGIHLHDLFTYMLGDNFGIGSATDHSLSWKLHQLSAKFIFSGMGLFYPLVLLALFKEKKISLFVLWLILAFIGINAVGIYDNVHLKEMLPALSILSAFAVAHLVRVYKLRFIIVLLAIWIVFFPNVIEALNNFKRVITGSTLPTQGFCTAPYVKPDEGTLKKLGLWVRDNTTVNDKVYVAGYGAQVQAYSERISPTIYFNVTQTAIAKTRFFSDLQKDKPAIILVPLYAEYKDNVDHDIRNFISAMTSKDYTAESCIYNYQLYRLRK